MKEGQTQEDDARMQKERTTHGPHTQLVRLERLTICSVNDKEKESACVCVCYQVLAASWRQTRKGPIEVMTL